MATRPPRSPNWRGIIAAGDIPGAPDLSGALGRLRASVERSPRAAIACGQLLRQTQALGTAGGLAAGDARRPSADDLHRDLVLHGSP